MPTFRVIVRINHPGSGAPAYNVWHARTTDVSLATDELNSAIVSLRTFYNSISAMYPSDASRVMPWDVARHGSDYAPVVGGTDETVGFTGTTSAGTGSGFAPMNIAACVSWSTSVRTRSGRGRTFVGPLSTNMLDSSNGTLANTQVVTLKSAADALITASNAANGWAWGVYSRKENVFRDFVGATVADQCASMRSRRD